MKRIIRSCLVTMVADALPVILIGCGPSGTHLEQTLDQTKITEIALTAKDYDVRRAAVMRLTDQGLLAKVAIDGEGWDVRAAAAKKLSDQRLLAKVAMEAPDPQVRSSAAARLTDPATLAQVGMWVKPELTRLVTDQALLAKIAVEATDWEVRRAAVTRLRDQTPLERLAAEAVDWRDRAAAVTQLTDQGLLARLAAKAKWPDVRVFAISHVSDQTLLHQLAEKDPHAAIRLTAVPRITDDAFLVQRLRTEPSATVRAAIVKMLHREESLRDVALTAYHQKDREQALQRLRYRRSPASTAVSAAHEALGRMVNTLEVETDGGKLLTLALDGGMDVLRAAAARRLSDPVALTQAALHTSDRPVMKILLAKLNETAALTHISGAADDRAMRLAAARKAGAKTWQEIFGTARAKGAAAAMLGDALAAVSLLADVQEEAVDAVRRACVDQIRRGDESHIPQMTDVLDGYGDTALAEAYLNSGQPDLEAAARSWADRRGYTIGTGAGSSPGAQDGGR